MPHTADTSPWRPFASLLLAMLLSSACIGMYAHDNRQHPIEAQYRQLSTLNAQSLLRYGETQTGIQADDRALVAFNILMSRYSAQMERQDKYACAKAPATSATSTTCAAPIPRPWNISSPVSNCAKTTASAT